MSTPTSLIVYCREQWGWSTACSVCLTAAWGLRSAEGWQIKQCAAHCPVLPTETQQQISGVAPAILKSWPLTWVCVCVEWVIVLTCLYIWCLHLITRLWRQKSTSLDLDSAGWTILLPPAAHWVSATTQKHHVICSVALWGSVALPRPVLWTSICAEWQLTFTNQHQNRQLQNWFLVSHLIWT